MRKHLLLTCALVASLTSAWAYDYDWASASGEGAVYYKLNSPKTGEATVVAGEWQYRDNVVIPDNITIGSGPNAGTYAVTTIGKDAFYYCYDVISVTLGANVETIKSYAFERASGPNGTGIVINLNSDALRTIESNAFHCVTLTRNMGTDTLAIGKYVANLDGVSNYFSWVTFDNVNHYYVDPSSTTLSVDADGVLYNKNKSKLYLHPQPYFHDEFVIPTSVKIVATFAFYKMGYIETKDSKGNVISYTSLKRITGGENVEKMGSVISGKYLETIPISSKITGNNMETTALMYTENYFMPTVDNSNPTFKLIDGVLYKYTSTDTILCYYFRSNTRTTFVVPSNVTKIAGFAFYGVSSYLRYIDYGECKYLKSSNIEGTAFLSTSNNLKFLNEDKLFKVQDGIMYTKADGAKPDFYQMVLYPSDVTLEDYVMPAQTKKVPRNVIKENSYVKTFNINDILDDINTEHLYVMRKLEYYWVNSGNQTYSSDEEGVLYNHAKTKLLAYPTGNERLFYKVAEGTKQIGVSAFRENKYLKGLDLGDAITTLIDGNSNNLYDMKALNFIRVGTIQPPTVTTNTFSKSMYQKGGLTTLYVPASAFEIYKKTSIWNRFNVVKDTGQFKSDVMNSTFDYYTYHHKQNLTGDGYEVPESVSCVGYILKRTEAEPQSYEGFTAEPFEQKILDRRGLIVDIYYTRNEYTLEWKNNGTTISSGSYRYGTPIEAPKNVEIEVPAGKHLVGWNTNSESSIAVNFDEGVFLRGNTTYHAIFADNAKSPYTINHYLQNINGSYPETPEKTDPGFAPFGSLTNATARSFTGFSAPESIAQQTIKEDGSTVVDILYTRNSHTITWMNGSSIVSSGSYPFGSILNVPNDQLPTENNMHFVGWNTDETSSVALTVDDQTVPDADLTYYAIFALNGSKSYTINHYEQNLDGSTYPNEPSWTESGKGIIGDNTTAKANANDGFTAQPFDQQEILSDGSTVVNIYYTRNRYDVIWMKGSEELSRNANVLYGTEIQAPEDPTAEAGYHFVGWNTVSSASTAISISEQTVPAGDVTYYAIFDINDTKHFTVKHYQENLDGSYPTTPTSTQTGSGTVGLNTDASVLTDYINNGFTALDFEQTVIKDDESSVVEIYYERNVHSITWYSHGGVFNGTYTTGSVKYGTPIVQPNYSYRGHSFKGWGKTSNATSWENIPATMPDQDLEYHAIWELNGYMTYWYWNFDGATDGGLFTTGTTKFGYPIEVTFGIPDRDHYEFIGWSTTPTGSIITDNNYGIMDEYGAQFYAQWKPNENTLTWDAKGGELSGNNYTHGSVGYGTEIISPTVTRTGYDFIGWGATENATEATNIAHAMPDEDLTYYAIWQIKQYTISWNINAGNDAISLEGNYTSGAVNYGTTIVMPTNPERKGYTFKGWATTSNATTAEAVAETMPDNDLTYYAVWEVHMYNMTWDTNGGEFTGSDPSGSVAYGTEVSMPQVQRIDPNDDQEWTFAGWAQRTDATPEEYVIAKTFNMPDYDLTYYAIWILKKNYVKWKYNYGEDDEFNVLTTHVDVGQPITAPNIVPERLHYQFIGWSAERNGDVITDGNYGTMESDKKEFYAQWQLNSHMLSWNANGGNALTGNNYTQGLINYNTAIVAPDDPTFTGYTFKGWATSEDGTPTAVAETMPDEPTTYYAIWSPNTYEVVWKYNHGADETFAITKVVFGEDIVTPPTEPARDNYNFIGWSANSTDETAAEDFGTLSTEGATFYAIWQLKKYSLAWDAQGGQLSGDYTQGEIGYGTTIVAPTATRTNFIFSGWGTSSKPDSIVTITTMPDSSVTFVANWIAQQYAVEWRLNDGTENNYISTNVAYGSTITPPDADPQREHYQFVGWSSEENGEVLTDYGSMDSDHKIFYAQWRINMHTLAWNASGGELSGEYTVGLVAYDAEITAPEAARTGYTLNGWGTYAEAPHSVEISKMPDNDIEYFALWTPNTYNVTWMRNDGSDEIFETTVVTFDNTIEKPSDPLRENYQFLGWAASTDGDVINDFGKMGTEDKAFFAQWQINQHSISWNRNANDDIALEGDFTTGTVDFGTTIVKPDDPERMGYEFVGWATSANATTAETVASTMPDNDLTYYAVWSAKTCDVTWMKNDGSDEVIDVTQVVFDSKIVAPSSNPAREHYEFVGWASTPEGEVIADFGKLASESAIFYAQWELRKYVLGWDANGGELSGDYTLPGEVAYGTPIVVPSVALANHILAGWGTTANRESAVSITTMPDSSVTYVAIWVGEHYVVEWRKNDGTEDNYTATNVDFENDIFAPETDPERAHYQFLGWSDSADGEVITDYGTMDSDHKIFYAQWQINTNTLAWNANGGELSGNYTEGEVAFDSVIIRPVATRTGYTFNGWNTYSDATDSISINTMPDNDIEYFAIWKVNNYNLAWRMNNATDSVFALASVNYGDTIKAPSVNPEREGFTFEGWAATETGTAIDSFGLMPAADTAFFAVWEAIEDTTIIPATFIVTWYMNNGTDSVFTTSSLAENDTIAAPAEKPVREQFTFLGWAATETGSAIGSFGLMPAADTSFFAVWEAVEDMTGTFAATWYMNNGTDSIFVKNRFAQGDSIAAPAQEPDRDGYTFIGWSTEMAGTLVTEFGTITADTAFYAVWEKNKYLVTWKFSQDSIFKTDTIYFGDAINAPVENPEQTGYVFKGWADAVNGDVIANFGTIASDTAFYAVWEVEVVPQYRAVWYFNDGTNSAFTTTMVALDASITAPASNPKRDDYVFKGWSKSATGSVTTNFGTMSANGAAFFAVWEALVSFTAPETFNTCESGSDHIELKDINNSQITFEWNVNGDIDSIQTDGYFEFTDEMALSGTIEVTGILGDTRVTKTINYQRNKDMMRTMWDDVITVVNGKGYFQSYRWYQNGVLVDTTDMHYEMGGLTGTYKLVAVTTDSLEITSCEMTFGDNEYVSISAYPNPVINTVLVKGSDVKIGNRISIVDSDGKVRMTKDVTDESGETINMSNLPQGVYIVKVGTQSVSIIKL